MQITINLYATLRRYQPGLSRGESLSLDVQPGATVRKVMIELGIPGRSAVGALVNGDPRKLDHVLSDGDVLSLFPPVAGG
jgi:molybdopterin converting factor small subunit